MALRYSARSDVGQVRKQNEDAYLADPKLGLFIVCDGVGGRASGEIASRETARLIWEWIKRENALIQKATEDATLGDIRRLCQTVRGAIQNACYLVHSLGELDPEQKGMSTTTSLVLVAGHTAVVGQVGDSRVYLTRDGQVHQLTEDHTLINFQLKHGLITPEQAQKSKVKNVITRAVGHHDYVEVDVHAVPLQPQDRLLLCSDGLYSYFADVGEVSAIMLGSDPEHAVSDAIELANARGGGDNITAMLVEYDAAA